MQPSRATCDPPPETISGIEQNYESALSLGLLVAGDVDTECPSTHPNLRGGQANASRRHAHGVDQVVSQTASGVIYLGDVRRKLLQHFLR